METPPQTPAPEDETAGSARKPLRILHLEDNSHDREFVHRVMEKAGMHCEFIYADRAQEFQAALDREHIDLILSDFTLPGYDGAEALALARSRRPEVPYIFVSGTIGEERAVESLKSGAVDYILKSNLSRLPSAIHAAIRGVRERQLRRQAELALRASEERFREMAGSIRDVFWIAPPDARRIMYVSPGYALIWGRPVAELHERPELWIESIVPEDRDRVLAALDTLGDGHDIRVEYRITRPDGTVRWVENRASPSRDAGGSVAHAVGVAADITDRKQLQEQLLQAQKMEALGQLAGGIAHDFNNLLTVINGYASLTLVREDLPEDVVRPLQQIFSAGERAVNLTRQLLVFSRKESVQLKPLDLNEGITETATMLGRLIGENISLTLSLQPGLPSVEAHMGMIEQVLVNLAVNARDAMPRGGKLVIATETREIGPAQAKNHPRRRPGRFARLSVSDTGTGIPPEVLPRVFEPFFTTKKPGEGTGLGLAMVFGIVETHHGWVEVESRMGEGTTFAIFLPVVAAPAPSAAPEAGQERRVAGGAETILLVEDEDAVREFARAALQHFGYRVLQASTGKDALETWKWHSSRIRLLLTDMVLPDNLSGLELARRLRAENPALKVICASGYTREMLNRLSPAPDKVRFLQKPYQPKLLAQAVRECLDEPS